jgi:Berberine and berberine like
MENAALVSRLQRIGNLQSHTSGDVGRHWSLWRRAVHVLKYEVVGANVVDLTNVWMVQRGNRASFLVKPVQAIRVVGKRPRQHLDGDVASEPGVARPVHFAHAAGADLGGDLIRAEASACCQGHGKLAEPPRLYGDVVNDADRVLIDAAVDGAARFSSPLSALIFFYMHGAATRPLPTETVFAARRAQWDFDAIGQWPDGRNVRPARRLGAGALDSIRAALTGQAYVNHLAADDRPETIRASFGENYTRLRQVKAMYDPTNLFRRNANISPA